MRKVFQEEYAGVFDAAGRICIRKPSLLKKVPEMERMSSERLVDDLKRRGKDALHFADTDAIIDALTWQPCSCRNWIEIMREFARMNLPRYPVNGLIIARPLDIQCKSGLESGWFAVVLKPWMKPAPYLCAELTATWSGSLAAM